MAPWGEVLEIHKAPHFHPAECLPLPWLLGLESRIWTRPKVARGIGNGPMWTGLGAREGAGRKPGDWRPALRTPLPPPRWLQAREGPPCRT